MEKVPGTCDSRGRKRLLPCAHLSKDEAINDGASLQLQAVLALQHPWLAAGSTGREATVCMHMRHSGEHGQHGQHDRRDEVAQLNHREAACTMITSLMNVSINWKFRRGCGCGC